MRPLDFDKFSPPGMLTYRGSNIAITDEDELYVQHGARAVTVHYSQLQWRLLAVAIARLEGRDHRGRITIEGLRGSVTLAKASRPPVGVSLTVEGRSGTVTVLLNANEASDLYLAARRRSSDTDNYPEGA